MLGGFYQKRINICSRFQIRPRSISWRVVRKGPKTASVKADRKWLIGILLAAVALGILAGAIAAGRLKSVISW